MSSRHFAKAKAEERLQASKRRREEFRVALTQLSPGKASTIAGLRVEKRTQWVNAVLVEGFLIGSPGGRERRFDLEDAINHLASVYEGFR